MPRFWLLTLLALGACWRSQPTPPVAPREVKRESKPTTATAKMLTPSVALATIESSYLGSMQRCYRARLKRDANARGHVVVTFTVDETGRLGYRAAKGVGKALELCVERAMAKWSFPAPAEETTFRLAFRLSSRT